MTRAIDVALTYAGEQEGYVRAVAVELREHGVLLFFAPFEEVNLWGEDLIPYLERVYSEWARLCVMFISKQYVDKAWPRHERQAALSRQLTEQSAYILPVRFDDTEVPGLSSSIYFVRAEKHTPVELSAMIMQKLASPTPAASSGG
ncbi:MAG: TIR domain-containing protein [Thermoplasmata archaeon]|nr:TIR domain-containing protein [Thermoplasmata archaeon]